MSASATHGGHNEAMCSGVPLQWTNKSRQLMTKHNLNLGANLFVAMFHSQDFTAGIAISSLRD